ncbi:TonB-linked outer membrane protein, SusC/RagA family [bacterium A37T11]|nr:TonB-linked outer membrane protein, SusC/RagA family [bacterium A37T11]
MINQLYREWSGKSRKNNTRLNAFRLIFHTLFLVCIWLPAGLYAQQNYSGTVKESDGKPLSEVSVRVKGTNRGTSTNASGQFNIQATKGETLLFSYLGYLGKEIVLTNEKNLTVVLSPESIEMDEAVVVGYGTIKKSDLTGAVARVSMSEKSTLPNVSIAQALSGATAGVNFQPKGLAGGDASLSVRGQTSLSANDNPLIVLDGIIYNGSLSDINVNDIEFIDILKDASAAAVYGSRSANGVILITTKKGTTDKPRISFNAYGGTQWMTNNPMKVMNADQYAVRMVDYYYQQSLYAWYKTNPTSDAGKPVRIDITDRQAVSNSLRTEEEKTNYLAGNDIDWVDQVMRKHPIIQSYDLSFSGRSEKVNYYASASYVGEEGILVNDQFKRYTLNTKVDGSLTSWLNVGLNLNYSNRDYSGLNASLDAARKASPLANNDLASPDDYSTYLTGETYMIHPLGYTKATNVDQRNNFFYIASAKLTAPFLKGLTYDFNYSNTYYTEKNNTFYPVSIADGASNKGKAVKSPLETRNWIFNNILSYVQTFGDHQVNATLLYSREKRTGESYTLTGQGFDNPVLGFDNLMLATILTTSAPSAWREAGISYMGRLNYTYKNRYLFTGTVRKDGYSGFGANQKYVTLPSASIGWLISEEPFLADHKSLYLKLRLSYGQNGNQGIGRYSSFGKISNTPIVFGSNTEVAVYPDKMGNPSLAWEKTSSYNLGVDFGVINNRITGSVDVYTSKTENVLVKRLLPSSSGYDTLWTNIGALKNKGIDLEIKSTNIKSSDFNWKSNFNFSLVRDKISKLYGGDNDRDVGNSWFVGQPISAIYDYRMTGGLWTEQDLYSGNILPGWYPGQYKYKDFKNDKIIDAQNDREIIGYRTPNFRFSIGNTFTYKNWGLFFLLNSIQGGNGYYMMNNYDVVNVSSRSDDVYRINQSAVRQYWTPDNGVNNATGIYNSPAVTSGVYESRSFVRLQDVSLSYSFSPEMLKRMGSISNLQIYLSAKNLYTWTNWSGWDPELASDNANYPAMRNVILGAKLSF